MRVVIIKTCEVCGKSIRTGWKYCHEHRNTRVDSEMKIIRNADSFTEKKINTMVIGFSFIFLMIVGSIAFNYREHLVKIPDYVLVFGTIIMVVTIALTLKHILTARLGRGSERYEEIVKSKLDKDRAKKEYDEELLNK